jgi:regulator of protease activity HflC (stomatin/prohibitin superfamily)
MKTIVEAFEIGLLFRDGRFARRLEPGRYRRLRLWVTERIVKVDMRVRTLVMQGQEIMTADKVTLRLTALAKIRVVDPVTAVLAVENYVEQVYRDVQLALRDVVSGLELEALLGQKARLGEAAHAIAAGPAARAGVEVIEVGIRDVMLPGEMKTILDQVIAARKRAEAAQITRREEIAATRSLANTADMVARNPTLMRLKELEALERIAAHGASIVIAPETVGLAMRGKA